MYKWKIVYIPQGCLCMQEETIVRGDNKLQAQEYFNNYYAGKILRIEGLPTRNY